MFDGFIEAKGRNPLQGGQIPIQNNSLTADCYNQGRYVISGVRYHFPLHLQRSLICGITICDTLMISSRGDGHITFISRYHVLIGSLIHFEWRNGVKSLSLTIKWSNPFFPPWTRLARTSVSPPLLSTARGSVPRAITYTHSSNQCASISLKHRAKRMAHSVNTQPLFLGSHINFRLKFKSNRVPCP